MSRVRLVFGTLCLAAAATAATAEENARFSGLTRNGDRVESGELIDWHEEKATPKLGGRGLFDEGNPFRWILNEATPPPAAPDAYVEFVGGDRLPGLVVGGGEDTPFDRQLSHILVEPAVPLDDPATNRTTRVRVTTPWLRRIVWEAPHPRPLRPGTLFHRDGRETTIRTLRWSDDTVLVLGPSGLETIPLGDVSEIHFPARDEWRVYAEEVAHLAPRGETTLVRWETRDGLVVTGSRLRFEPERRGDHRRHEHWFHRVQPAWSLDPLWVRFGSVRSVRFWTPHEVPLSRFTPAEVRRASVFGASWDWRPDASVQGSTLRSGARAHGWGFGVQARTELHFDLPPFARSFESGLGLDGVVGSGGCVQASVHLGADLAKRVYESPLLVGSGESKSTGRLDLPEPGADPRRLVLVVDMARGKEPAGGDPFDVRDACDWLDPLLFLDREELLAAVRAVAPEGVPALAEWTPGRESPVVLGSVWDRSDSRDPRYRTTATIDGPYATWARTLRIGENDRWLAIAVHYRGDDDGEEQTSIQVRVDGRTLGQFDVPRWADEWGPNPVLVPLDPEWRGGEVDVELVVVPRKPGVSDVVWGGVAPVEHPPHLLRLFDEELVFPEVLLDGEGTATVTLEDASRGEASLVVTPPMRGRTNLPDLAARVRERPRVGEYRYLRFAWRKDGGKRIGLQIAHEGEFGSDDDRVRPRILRDKSPGFQMRRHVTRDRRGHEVGYRYDASFGIPEGRAAIRLASKPPEEWQVVTRDLFADFGEFELTGLGFDALDGDAAYFDEVYLARKGSDFGTLDVPTGPGPLPPEFAVWETDPWRFGRVLERVTPGFASTEIGNGAILLKEYRGRENVLKTFGPEHHRDCVLRRTFVVPEGRRTKLVTAVSRDDDEEWKLDVVVNGERLLSEVVGKQTRKDDDGWAEFEVDLSKFAGQPIVLDVHNRRHEDRRGDGYFARLEIVTE